MASTDAKAIPVKNAAYRITFPIFDADGDLVSGAASLDSEVSKDAGNFADCSSEATEIQSTGIYYLDLTSDEMNADTVVVQTKTSTTGAKTAVNVLYTAARSINDLAYPTVSGRSLDVSAGGEAGVDWANVGSPTTTVGLSGTTVKTATDVETDTADIQSRLPAALVSGRIDASVGAMAANTVTATAIANGAIDAATFAAGAIDAAAIADGAIDAATFAAGAIDSAAVADGAIDAATLATGTITAAKFAAGAIDAAAIATAAIDADAIAANAIGASELNSDVITDIWQGTALTESYAADGAAATPAQLLYLILALLSEFSISTTTLTAKKLDGSTTAATFTLDDATNPTSITRAT